MIAKAPFGRTGHMSTRTIFGAAALGNVTQEEADKTLETLLEYGVNHIDTAASYGESELRIGPWMKEHRGKFFLATKTGERTYDAAKAEFMKSLERLQVDSVDLVQLHYLVDKEQWETAMGDNGALKWVKEAKEQGLTKFIGVTGHDVAVAQRHLESTDEYDFDSILMPYSYIMMKNSVYAANVEKLLARAKERKVAVQTIKSVARRLWLEGAERFANTWYEPFTEQADIDKAVHWILGNEQVFLNTLGDIHFLPKVLDAANRFESRPSDEAMDLLVKEREVTPMFV
ncbi:MAG: aldo/keto reductase [Anaerolineae bacterium]|nr:aldo/keto reductase [Anaerolineae bacterium]MDQ7035508.1 aldo/keto reductase [Anaerolineae bacterium]